MRITDSDSSIYIYIYVHSIWRRKHCFLLQFECVYMQMECKLQLMVDLSNRENLMVFNETDKLGNWQIIYDQSEGFSPFGYIEQNQIY